MKAYFISGLGADHRAFERIKMPAGYEVIHISWISALENESLKDYSLRMAQRINTNEPFILVGLSFGGMVAVEIAKVYKPQKLLLLSSAATRDALPSLYKWGGRFNLDKLVPVTNLSVFRPFFYLFFGTKDTSSKRLLDYFRERSDPAFLRWAIEKITRWTNTTRPDSILQIHGEKDIVFPAEKSGAQYFIPGAGHLCVFTHSRQVNKILEKVLTGAENPL